MNEEHRICIVCPAGCPLTIRQSGVELIVSGNRCPRGKRYGTDELTDPRRTVTFVIALAGHPGIYLPVKTDHPLPVRLIPPLLTVLRHQKAIAPVKIGDIFIKNFADSGINIIFTNNS